MEDNMLTDKICHAQELVSYGDREGACTLYIDLWDEAVRTENQYQACIVAHFMAHTHVEPEEQFDWHLRALHAADSVGDERVSTFYPSLYANLGEVSLRLGDLAQARMYIVRASETEHVLQDDGYRRLLRSLIVRVTQAIERGNMKG